MNPFFYLIVLACDIAQWVILVSVVFSWLQALQILNTRNSFLNQISQALYRLTEPVYARIRRFMPTMFGGIDVAPVVVLIAIAFIRYSVVWISLKFGI